MKVTITRTRMAMPGEFYAYDAEVSTDQVDRSQHSSFICHDGREFVTFEAATMPAEQVAMSCGWEKYEAGEAHRKACKPVMLALAQSVYPELRDASKWHELWQEIPGFNERHSSREAEYKAA